MAVICLLTDFGISDPFVGTMHGVILSLCPDARIVDLCHGVPPQDIGAAGFLLERSYGYFPPGTIHVAVVDPGVGGERVILAGTAAGHTFLAPDNGLLAPLENAVGGFEALVTVSNPALRLDPRGTTFHGRDIFAPAAAHLALGVPLASLGPPASGMVCPPPPRLVVSDRGIEGEVVYIDRFGNLVTNISGRAVERVARGGSVSVHAGGRRIGPVRSSYTEVDEGELLAVIGGFGRLEVSARNGSARERLGATTGDAVRVSIEIP